MKVLVIDDELIWVKQIDIYLSSIEDFFVTGSTSKDEALKLAKALNPDVILLDLNFDGKLEGISLIPLIKSVCSSKIIILTVSDDKEDITNSLLAGANNYINKESYKALPDFIRDCMKRPSPAEVLASLVQDQDKIVNKVQHVSGERIL